MTTSFHGRVFMATGLILGGLLACETPSPRPASLDRDAGIEMADRADSLVRWILRRDSIEGAAVALVDDGAVVLARGYGLADVAGGRALSDTTPINVASLSKAVTAWGVLSLVREGKMSLEQPIEDVLARWRFPPSPFESRRVTATRLLNHTAGVGLASVPWFEPAGAPTIEDVLAGSTGDTIRLEGAPGDAWSYSGGGYTVLQLAVEDLTGERFADFMGTAVFEPLGMPAASFAAPGPGTAIGYDEEGAPVEPAVFVGAAAGGLLLSAVDAARLLQAYGAAWHGEEPVLDAATLRNVAGHVTDVRLEGVEDAFYGLGHGVHLSGSGRALLYHSGGNPGFRAYMIVDPGAQNGLFVATNSERGVPLIAELRELWGEANDTDLPPLF